MDVVVHLLDSKYNKVSKKYVKCEFLGKSLTGDALQISVDTSCDLGKQSFIEIIQVSIYNFLFIKWEIQK